jgi:hypothetical protein
MTFERVRSSVGRNSPLAYCAGHTLAVHKTVQYTQVQRALAPYGLRTIAGVLRT